MLDHLAGTNQITLDQTAATPRQAKAVLRMRDDDRMAGSIPVWEKQNSAARSIADTLSNADTTNSPDDFDTALSYAAQEPAAGGVYESAEEFGFGDLIDMINPLQHIPLVSHLYRSVTGDEIRPISSIVGGTIFGGPAGAAGALANVIVEHETGRDITGNVMAAVSGGEKPSFRSVPDTPESRLNSVAQAIEGSPENPQMTDLPGTMLSFTDLGHGKRLVHERYSLIDDDRMAGTMVRSYTDVVPPETKTVTAPRDPITRLSFSYND